MIISRQLRTLHKLLARHQAIFDDESFSKAIRNISSKRMQQLVKEIVKVEMKENPPETTPEINKGK